MTIENSGKSGIRFPSLLTLLFIGLKLTNTIDWSWFWVLSPIWIPFTLVIALIAIAALALSIDKVIIRVKNKRRVKRGGPSC